MEGYGVPVEKEGYGDIIRAVRVVEDAYTYSGYKQLTGMRREARRGETRAR